MQRQKFRSRIVQVDLACSRVPERVTEFPARRVFNCLIPDFPMRLFLCLAPHQPPGQKPCCACSVSPSLWLTLFVDLGDFLSFYVLKSISFVHCQLLKFSSIPTSVKRGHTFHGFCHLSTFWIIKRKFLRRAKHIFVPHSGWVRCQSHKTFMFLLFQQILLAYCIMAYL